MSDTAASPALPYAEPEQQREAAFLGMYVFLGSEIMLFGGLFMVALAMRVLHPHEVVEASRQLHVWIGGINTAVLLTSSLAVALAVHAAHAHRRRLTMLLLLAAAALGLLFLGIKAVEYTLEYKDGLLPGLSDPERFSRPIERLFMDLYFIATGLHALHVTVGIVLLLVVALRPSRPVVVELSGLYWHLVDAIWIFLYPVLYLAR